MIIWAIVPVKPLGDSKSRLSHILPADERAALTTAILKRTLEVLGKVQKVDKTLVVSRDTAVLKIARQHGTSTYGETDRQGLNSALTRASHIAAAQRADCVMILPADLPLLTSEDVNMMINSVGESGRGNRNSYYYQKRAMAICSDHNDEGTNALLICPPNGFTFQYGPNSFSLHLDEAKRLEMDRRIVHTPGMKFDLDTEEDWNTYQAIQGDALALGQTVHS